jgi:hypothetical protein
MTDDELRKRIEQLQAELARREQAAQTQTNTGGGAAVQGDANPQRDFIGRDKILLIVKNYADAGGGEQDKKTPRGTDRQLSQMAERNLRAN